MLIGDLSTDQLNEWNILWEEVTILYPALGYYLKFRQGLMYFLRTTVSVYPHMHIRDFLVIPVPLRCRGN